MLAHPISVRAYYASVELLQSAFSFASGCLTGLWLALLSDRRRYAIDKYYYDRESMYQTFEHNKGGFWEWEARAIDQWLGECRRVAVLSAGGGREVLALLRRGVDVAAWECHADLRAFANDLLQAEGYDGVVREAPRDACPHIQGGHDGAVVGWGAYMLIRGSARRIAFLRDLRERLKPGAPVLLSFVMRPRGSEFALAACVGNAMRHLSGTERIEVGDYLGPNFVHMFTRGEIAKELAAAGYHMALFGNTPYGYAVAIPHPGAKEANLEVGVARTATAAT